MLDMKTVLSSRLTPVYLSKAMPDGRRRVSPSRMAIMQDDLILNSLDLFSGPHFATKIGLHAAMPGVIVRGKQRHPFLIGHGSAPIEKGLRI